MYVGVGLYAYVRGGRVERLGALIVTLAAIATVLAQERAQFLDHDEKLLIVDLLQLGALAWLAGRSRTKWVLVAAAMQILATMTHLAMALSPGVSGRAYLTAYMVWNYGVLASLVIGTALRGRRGEPRSRSRR